ncbi:MAG: DNA polymerase IV [Treponema sp.]|nr:DNA polymerase IV [Treponema sp.]
MIEIKHYYLHVDLDAFFASVEQLDNPEYRGKPVIVGGMPGEKRSVVSTASYEARKYGVHSAMPVSRAYQLCPNGIYVHGRMKRYSELSYQIMNIFKEFSPDIQQISIDEAFIDLTGTEKLFGPPQETAMKIKQLVKDNTGLTVSVGLAPTKYLAKIASDMNKPDGFYKIEAGQEENFMLNLPLKKVWGIGDKTYEALKNAGLRTTRDIHEKSLEVLTFMFGNNTGSFLYNVVRGIEAVDFDKKAKSHSISNETTFPYDVTDTYAAETTILELCHSVMFRLLREKGFSRTVMIKIRYEDFTTVSIQKTYQNYIMTLDSLYSCARELFQTKYEKGRGIRLIGVALENIDTEEKPVQQSLFDDGSEKKQKVESAILTLEKKHPEIKIHKARMLQKLNEVVKTIAVFILGSLFFNLSAFKLYAQKATISDEESTYEISGYVKEDIKGYINTTFGYGNPFGFSADLPVFKQEIDLSALIHITPQLYFAMEFLDEFKHNSFTLGYNGKGYLKEFKFSNRSITFPSTYSSNLLGYGIEGGDNQAPGLMFHFEDIKNNKFEADILLRYDMVKTKTATFYGNNSVNQTTKNLDTFVHSYMFYIPSEQIANICAVYIQSDDGKSISLDGMKFTKLSAAEYSIIIQDKLLILSKDVKQYCPDNSSPYILVSFSTADGVSQVLQETGSYDDPQTFAGSIQQYFSESVANLQLKDYSSLTEQGMITAIDGKPALIIQSPLSFSPYICANLYEINQLSNADYEFAIINKSNQKEAEGYIITFDVFDQSKSHAVISKTDSNAVLPSSPKYRYPFADLYPYVYLSNSSDIPLVFVEKTISPVKNYDIGKFVQKGSVRVYRNGILENNAIYDSGTGFVTLNPPASELDKIYITYREESNELSSGAFSTGLGFTWKFTPALVLDISYTGLYPFLQKNEYATSEKQKQSFTALTTGLNYKTKLFSLSDALSLAYENPNLSNVLIVNKPEKSKNQTFYLGQNDGTKTQNTPASSSIPELEADCNFTVNNFKGKEDKKISGYKIPLSYDFTKASKNQNLWASADITLSKADSLYKASEFEFAFLPDASLKNQNLDVYLILGIGPTETKEELPLWKITSLKDQNVIYPLDLNNNTWQTVKIKITHQQRARLKNNHNARIIIVKQSYDSSTDKAKGTLFAGPYKLINSLMEIDSGKSLTAHSEIIKDATDISWFINSAISQEKDKTLTATSYFTQSDFTDYKTVNLEFAITKPASFEFELLSADGLEALDLKLSPSLVESLASQQVSYHTLSINLQDKKLFIDDAIANPEQYELNINHGVVPSVQKLTLIPQSEENTIEHLYISKLFYKDVSDRFITKNLSTAQINFNSGYINAQSEQGLSFKKGKSNPESLYINSTIKASYTLAGINAAADAATNTNNGLSNAGHQLVTQSSLFRLFDFGELYRFSKEASSSEKKNYIKLNTKAFYSPFFVSTSATAAAKKTESTKSQEYLTELCFNLDLAKTNTSLLFKLNLDQKQTVLKTKFYNYFSTWYDTSKFQFDGGSKNALRNVYFMTNLNSSILQALIAPQITFSITGNLKTYNSNDYSTADLLSFVLPFTGKNNAVSFEAIHKASLLQKTNASNYAKDLAYIFKTQNDFDFFFKLYPLLQGIPQINAQTSSLTASNEYNLIWKRKLFNNITDFYIPLSAQAGFIKDINKTHQTASQSYVIKTGITNSFINLFGDSGDYTIFEWYKQEEFTNTLNMTLRFNSGKKKPDYQISDNSQITLFLKDSDNLSINSSFSLDNRNSLKLKTGALWTHGVNKSLLLSLTKLVWPGASKTTIVNTMSESLSLSLSKDKKTFSQAYEFSHNCELRFLKNCTINSGAGIIFADEKNKTFKLSLEYMLGAKIVF